MLKKLFNPSTLRPAPLLLLLLVLSGCTAVAGTQSRADLPETTTVAPPGQGPALLPQDGGRPIEVAEDTVVRLPWEGKDRLYRLYVPRRLEAGRRAPLVLVLHGAFGSAAKISKKSGFSELGERHGFIVAYPQGTSLARTWNSGHCCGRSYKKQVDDVGFLARVIEEVKSEHGVDPDRIYMVGESNGGMMAYRYAAERTSELAAIGVVAGTIGGPRPDTGEIYRIPKPEAPIALMAIHGRDDKRIPYAGTGGKTISAEASIRFLVKNNLCAKKPQEAARYFGGSVLWQWWAGCSLSSNIVLLTLEDFGHDWPNEKTARALGNEGGQAFDAAPILWHFLRTKRRWRKIDLTPATPTPPPAAPSASPPAPPPGS